MMPHVPKLSNDLFKDINILYIDKTNPNDKIRSKYQNPFFMGRAMQSFHDHISKFVHKYRQFSYGNFDNREINQTANFTLMKKISILQKFHLKKYKVS